MSFVNTKKVSSMAIPKQGPQIRLTFGVREDFLYSKSGRHYCGYLWMIRSGSDWRMMHGASDDL